MRPERVARAGKVVANGVREVMPHEVVCWVVKGMSNRDIGDILGGASRATARKPLERVYETLGVETRTAAASVAMQRVSELKPA